ncbi:Tetratricopeptide repeat (TPR) superfamily protein [Trifolium repens]|nr:Tetratricopeptide repeat (TPR) superfamily protein [Trifolium repens]
MRLLKKEPVELLLGKAYSDFGHVSDAIVVYDQLISTHTDDFRGYLAKVSKYLILSMLAYNAVMHQFSFIDKARHANGYFVFSVLGSFVESHPKNKITWVWLCARLNMLIGKVGLWLGERQSLLMFDLEKTALETLND